MMKKKMLQKPPREEHNREVPTMLQIIPEMTNPLSRYWHQPPLDDIAVYDDIAIMDRDTLEGLPEYSMSIPTGTYEGKMWKRMDRKGWTLCWYKDSDVPGRIDICSRPIRVLKGE